MKLSHATIHYLASETQGVDELDLEIEVELDERDAKNLIRWSQSRYAVGYVVL